MLRIRMLSLLTLMFLLSVSVSPRATSEDGVSTCPADKNPLTLDPPEVMIKYGQEVSVNCTSTVEDHEGMQWCNGIKCDDMEEESAFIPWSGSVSDWNVNLLCKIKLNDSLECSKHLKITVYKIPDEVYLHPVNAAVEGTQHKLQCDIINVAPVQNVTVTWSKDNVPFVTKTFNKTTKTPVNESSIVEVSLSRGEDGAQFKCEAQLDFGSETVVSSNMVNVPVHYAPELINKTDHFDVEEGVNITLSCEADGKPPPVYNWTTDRKMLDHNNPTYMITEVNANATYTCTASNDVGNETVQINVYVKNKITPPILATTTPAASEPQNDCSLTLMPSELVVKFGESALINCSTSVINFSGMGWEAPFGGSGFVQTPLVTWEVKQLDVWNPEPFCYVTLDNDKQCTLKPSITVYKTPDKVLVSPLSDEPMVEDTEFMLRCHIIDVAPEKNLTVKWFRGNENVHTEIFNDNTTVTPHNVTSTLKVIAKRNYNGIHFTCKAELHLGPNGPEPVPTVTSEPYIAVVRFAPTFNRANVSMEIRPGENVTFECLAEGNPAPEIHWNYTSANNVRETTRGRQTNISIIEATSTNAGVYICVATNKVGKVTRFVTATIKDHTDESIPGVSWWHIVLMSIIIAIIGILILTLLISLCNYYKKHGQYSFINGEIPLTTISASGKA